MLSSPRYGSGPRQTPDGQPTDGPNETVQDIIAFFYDLLRDYPELVARVNQALEERYDNSARHD